MINKSNNCQTFCFFFTELYNILNDGNTRYFVPEVNSKTVDLESIVSDFIDTGFKFVDKF